MGRNEGQYSLHRYGTDEANRSILIRDHSSPDRVLSARAAGNAWTVFEQVGGLLRRYREQYGK